MKRKISSATIRDVANLAGVSVATISRFMNNKSLLAENTATKVQAAMSKLNFIPNPIARNLSTNRTNTIGLVINDIGGDFFTPLLDGIIEATEKNDFNLLIFTSKRSDHYNHALLGPIYTDGLIVFLDSLAEEDIRRLHASGHPIVLIHQSPPAGLDIPVVTIENKAASTRIVNHLIEQHGRKRIVFLQGPEHNEDSYWREFGYREALRIHNLPIDPDLVLVGGFDRFEAKEEIGKLLRDKIQFDAVFAGDDEAAIGTLQALKEFGISVPEEVAVVGFDDQRLAAFLNPRLTTVHAPTDLVGMNAAEQLIKMISNESVEGIILLPTELVIRESCGCCV
jgi:LacI family transcriptional regulator